MKHLGLLALTIAALFLVLPGSAFATDLKLECLVDGDRASARNHLFLDFKKNRAVRILGTDVSEGSLEVSDIEYMISAMSNDGQREAMLLINRVTGRFVMEIIDTAPNTEVSDRLRLHGNCVRGSKEPLF